MEMNNQRRQVNVGPISFSIDVDEAKLADALKVRPAAPTPNEMAELLREKLGLVGAQEYIQQIERIHWLRIEACALSDECADKTPEQLTSMFLRGSAWMLEVRLALAGVRD